MTKNHMQAGFTLIEMAFVILIMGLIVGSVFSFYTPQLEQKRQQLTIDRENKIARALSDFAQAQNRLPCPAAPEDVPVGNARVACASNTLRNGIVPFRTLGLTQDDIMDGFGNPITYSITEAVSQVPTGNAHDLCRTDNIWVMTIVTPPSTANINPNKARFCCSQVNAATEMRVFQDSSKTTPVSVVQTTFDGTFAAVDAPSPVPTPANIADDTLAYFSYVLVSHGKNGDGSYTIGAAARKPLNISNTSEAENADDDNEFVVLPRNTVEGADFFDDIVLWRTQAGLMRETGSNSCARP